MLELLSLKCVKRDVKPSSLIHSLTRSSSHYVVLCVSVCVDILLCHDDELDTRRVAFALYLTPSWSKEDGGLLDLFDMDGEYSRVKKMFF